MASSNTARSNNTGKTEIHYAPIPAQPNIEDHFKSVGEGKETPIVLHNSYGM